MTPHINDVRSRSRNLRAGDLGEPGELDVTIEDLRQEDFYNPDGTTAQRWVSYFEGLDRGLVLNKKNLAALARLCGSDLTADWVGKRVRLFSTTALYRGKRVAAIRVRGAGT